MDARDHASLLSTPWVEKYRPVKIKDVAHQTEVVAALEQAVERGGGNLPHLLFYGPPGTGKTSLALALVREIFPKEILSQRVLELNASDERGIRVVREKIKGFAQGAVGQAKIKDGKTIPPFKVIILDEADAVTGEAQTALRRTMETYSTVTRFILICNYISRIIAPLASRCAKFRFQPLPTEVSLNRLSMICKAEQVNASEDLLKLIITRTNGDLRKALMTLQSASRMVPQGSQIGDTEIALASGELPQELLQQFRSAMSADSSFEKVQAVVEDVVLGGYPADRLLHQLCDLLVEEDYAELDELQKSALIMKMARAESCLADGASERLQLLDVGARGMYISKSRENSSSLFKV